MRSSELQIGSATEVFVTMNDLRVNGGKEMSKSGISAR
jgi:hypothetical protein